MSTVDEILEADLPVDGTSRDDYENPKDELAIRRLLIDIARLERKLGQVKALRQQVSADYEQTEHQLEERIAKARAIIQAYIENVNDGEAVSFPDVGSAHLTRRGPRLYVKDADAFEAWALEMGHVTTDVSGALKAAREGLKANGLIAHGCEVEPGGTSLTVKR